MQPSVTARVADYVRRARDVLLPGPKDESEMRYWRSRARVEGSNLSNSHYEHVFTKQFDVSADFFRGKHVLDIGCGPRGSLEWADKSARRVGLDPLVDEYREFGISEHAMEYAASGAEKMPFVDGSFEVVSVLNSLDHVDDVAETIREITRVTASGGTLLLLVEVLHKPRPNEPHWLGWDIVDQFIGWTVAWSARTGIRRDHDIYRSIDDAIAYRDGPGILRARLTKE